jgi:hypothetical protein
MQGTGFKLVTITQTAIHCQPECQWHRTGTTLATLPK